MKLFFATALTSFFLASSAFAAASETVVCKGRNPMVDEAEVTIRTTEGAAPFAKMTLWVNDDHETKKEEHNFELLQRDINVATIRYEQAVLDFAHHNTVVTLMADGNVFGRQSLKDQPREGAYNGVLFYQSGNGKAAIHRFNVICQKK